jgi:hypothetical protein
VLLATAGRPIGLVPCDSERLGLSMLSGKFSPILYCLGVSPKEKDGSLGEGPLQMDVADFLARGASDLTCGFRLSFNLLLRMKKGQNGPGYSAIED